ncbi:hypothetical protein Glove_319g109 [Diversispora epigaea]|uniref:Uncharacterized protein n=1 Tax=Diversispora epigaea TaxID=1348612 RepID=A0A397HWU1_9GLOM|nr:hypothetical protein Glove_319g109 [Diversispora epigaea]
MTANNNNCRSAWATQTGYILKTHANVVKNHANVQISMVQIRKKLENFIVSNRKYFAKQLYRKCCWSNNSKDQEDRTYFRRRFLITENDETEENNLIKVLASNIVVLSLEEEDLPQAPLSVEKTEVGMTQVTVRTNIKEYLSEKETEQCHFTCIITWKKSTSYQSVNFAESSYSTSSSKLNYAWEQKQPTTNVPPPRLK